MKRKLITNWRDPPIRQLIFYKARTHKSFLCLSYHTRSSWGPGQTSFDPLIFLQPYGRQRSLNDTIATTRMYSSFVVGALQVPDIVSSTYPLLQCVLLLLLHSTQRKYVPAEYANVLKIAKICKERIILTVISVVVFVDDLIYIYIYIHTR